MEDGRKGEKRRKKIGLKRKERNRDKERQTKMKE